MIAYVTGNDGPSLRYNRVMATTGRVRDEVTAVDEAWRSASAYLAPALIEGLNRHSGGEASWIEPMEGTLVMADISGFTKMSERLAEIGKEGAEWLTNTINLYFESMLDAARQQGGSNLKFGGDALLLSFTGADHAERAVRAALAMQSANRRFAAVRLDRERIRLKMSIGVHSGRFWSAAAGLPGHRMQHLILGQDACQGGGGRVPGGGRRSRGDAGDAGGGRRLPLGREGWDVPGALAAAEVRGCRGGRTGDVPGLERALVPATARR